MNLSFRLKIVLFVLLPVSVLYLAGMVYSLTTLHEWTTRNTIDHLSEHVASTADRFDVRLRELAQTAEMTAAFISHHPILSENEIYDLLTVNVNRSPMIFGSAIAYKPYAYDPTKRLYGRYVNRVGDQLKKWDPIALGYDYTAKKQAYWHVPQNTGKAIWTEPYFDEGAGNILMSTYSAPFTRDGKFNGIALVDIPLIPLWDVMELGLAVDLDFSVVSGSGKYIFSPDSQQIDKPTSQFDDLRLKNISKTIKAGQPGVEIVAEKGDLPAQWIFYCPIKSTSWVLFGSIPKAYIESAAHKQFRHDLVLLVATLILLIMAMWFLSIMVSRPLASLRQVVSEYARGNLGVRADIKSKDEIGALAGSFNSMAENLGQREAKLRESEERYRRLTENAKDLIWRTDHDGRVLFVNSAVSSMLGYTVEEATGLPMESYFTSESQELADSAAEEALASDSPLPHYDIELEYIRKDGRVIPAEARISIIRNEKGEPLCFEGISRDISKRKKAEEALRISEEANRSYITNAPYGLFVTNQDGRFIDVNEAGCRIVGYSPEELLNLSISDMISPNNPPEAFSVFETLVTTGSVQAEMAGLKKDGTEIYVSVKAVSLSDDRHMAFISDITEHKLAEKALRDSEGRYLALIDQSPVAYEVYDADGLQQIVNTAYESLWSLKAEDSVGKFNVKTDPQVEKLGLKPFVDRAYAGETVQLPEYTWDPKISGFDGRERRLRTRVYPLKDESGTIINIVVTHEDITDQYLADKAKKESEESYRALLEGIPDIVIRYDRDLRHLYVSENVSLTVDLTAEQYIGKTNRELGYPSDMCDFWDSKILDVFEKALPIDTEFTFEGKDGLTTIDWRLRPEFDSNGEVKSVIGIARDVTAQRKAEQDYQILFQEMLEGFALHEIICDDDGKPVDYRFLAVNPAFERMTGLKSEIADGKTVRELMPGIEQHWIDKYGKVALTGEPAFFENFAEPLGKYFEVTAFRPTQGQFACIFSDVTDRRKAENARLESMAKLRFTFDEAPIGVATVGLDRRFINCNKAFCEFTGYTESEMQEKCIADITYEQDRHIGMEDLRDLISGKKQKSSLVRKRYVRKDGKIVWGEVIINLIRNQEGQPQYFIPVISDITDRKLAEETLKKSEERFRLLFEHAPVGYQSLDVNGNFIVVNETWCNVLGYKKEEVIGRNFSEFLHPDFREHFQENFPKFKGMGYILGVEFEMIKKDGSEIVVSFEGRVGQELDGSFKQTHCVLHDITEQKRAGEEKAKLESQLQQAQKMESVGRLAGGVAHDFNNLLTGITGNIQLAQMDLSPEDPLFDTLSEVNDAADRAAELTRQLLAFSRKQIIKPKVIDPNNLIENMHKMLVRLIGEDIDLNTIPGKDIGRIKADPGQVEQIILNLAVNARDAMPDGGKLTIETRDVVLDENFCKKHINIAPGDFVMLGISDNGEGIEEETRKNIFDPFFTTKAEGEGTGLGLSTVYGIVKQHGGAIDVYSEIGKGTTFKVYFPMVRDQAEAIIRKSDFDDLPRGTETIFLVEDETIVRNIATKTLSRQGYKVLGADDGAHALVLAKKHDAPIDLLLTDVVMPNMNGRELAQEMKKLYPGIKILFTSGYTENIIAHHGILEEGLEFIGKPYTPQAITRKVRSVLDK